MPLEPVVDGGVHPTVPFAAPPPPKTDMVPEKAVRFSINETIPPPPPPPELPEKEAPFAVNAPDPAMMLDSMKIVPPAPPPSP